MPGPARTLSGEDDRRVVLAALQAPRGRYGAERTAQLSGVPVSTVYEWARRDVFLPDYRNASPMQWSYRDLVYLRLLAWLRSRDMPRPWAARHVNELRVRVAKMKPSEIRAASMLKADANVLLMGDEIADGLSGEQVLAGIGHFAQTFDLLEPIADVSDRPISGPNLVRPSSRTQITPSVLGGEPRILGTRIPTSTVFALRRERSLSAAQIVELYPGVTLVDVEEAERLEGWLRRAS